MTCIAALEHDSRVHMAGDSAFSTDNEVWIQSESKIFRRGDILIGICGAARFEPVMRYLVQMPKLRNVTDVGQWLNVELAYEIRRAHQQDGYTTEKGAFEIEDCAAIVGVSGFVYVMEPDLCFWRPRCGYHAIGSGAGPAFTSMKETADRKFTPRTRLKRALERATSETTGVRPPFTFEVL